ncbi:hypothetical protein BV20DRAFT_10989 [Pilatotrama ljubarskyi]|nr:hypothetical protein BV20DRAFT_10989 [Pilatotrama ljubarskyi]
MPVAELPLDIVHVILQQYIERGRRFSVDRRTLRACSLVCRAWRDIAQPLLYKKVLLHTDWPLDPFRGFLRSNPRIATTVQELLVQFSFSVGMFRATDRPRALDPLTLFEILRALPHVAHLWLLGVTLLGWPAHTPLPAEPLKLSKITMIGVLSAPYFGERCSRFDFLRLFTEIDDLKLSGGEEEPAWVFLKDVPTADSGSIPPPLVRQLSIIGSEDPILNYNYECGGLDKEHLRSLRIETFDDLSLRHVGKLLRCYGQGIRDMDLNLCNAVVRNEDPGLWRALGATTLSRLERLTLRIPSYGRFMRQKWTVEEAHQEICKAYGTILSEISPGTLRELKWVLPEPRTEEAYTRTLRYLAPLLSRAVQRFSTLEVVIMVVRPGLPLELCAAVLQKTLPVDILQRNMIRSERWSRKYASIQSTE